MYLIFLFSLQTNRKLEIFLALPICEKKILEGVQMYKISPRYNGALKVFGPRFISARVYVYFSLSLLTTRIPWLFKEQDSKWLNIGQNRNSPALKALINLDLVQNFRGESPLKINGLNPLQLSQREPPLILY